MPTPASRKASRSTDDTALLTLIRAIVAGDTRQVSMLLGETPGLATQSLLVGATRASAVPYYLAEIGHYIYEGDTALHVAAAAYDRGAVRGLLAAGASIGAANRRGAQAIHYAADGSPTSGTWNPAALEEVVVLGYLVSRLERLGIRPSRAIAISAVIRGSYHLYQGAGGFIGNAIMGVIFGVLYLRWRRVTPMIVAHTLIDAVAFIGYALLAGHVSWLPSP